MNMEMSDHDVRLGVLAVIRDLNEKDLRLEEVRISHMLLWQGLGWSREQVRLWLRCLPGIKVRDLGTDDPAYGFSRSSKSPDQSGQPGQDLGELVAAIAVAAGRPVPLAEVCKRLPAGVLATEVMIKEAVKGHPGLKMVGPLVKVVQ